MDKRIVETPVEARQGRRGLHIFYVLVAGVALVVIAFAIIAMIKPA